ncbi:receptor-interacting serine/threonine-protein kinase 3-like isoform X2 [Xiphophorus hellerii]|uniref:receptor-interacting serine/threonine-protein kinase 3-like isoform X2 n=1 Tax=Xiphophorus hellerii TaxID=8084 RepID=UPI0013B38D2F|nr:receptor-interacting serine/threonine-protein kinase 3-like isoform X2 [Xiphophorus hellerii]
MKNETGNKNGLTFQATLVQQEMALPSSERCHDVDLDENIKWKEIGRGGFGIVYKVRHKVRDFVAIKLLRNTGTTDELYKEAECLTKLSSEFVLRVYGIYNGNKFPQFPEGIVMEFMEKGSIQTLQKDLSSPPPLPLAVRLAYQVAKGIQYIHSKSFVHHDLKPSNILLDNDFNAKLADFGLSRETTSVLPSFEQSKEWTGGTIQYIPPEAFALNYKIVRSFDVYSYGILLWSILSGEVPYPGKPDSLVEHRVEHGDRPDVSLCLKEEKEKKTAVTELMKHCWKHKPSDRPDFNEIVHKLEPIFSLHKDGIDAAIRDVLLKLRQNSRSSSQLSQANAADLVPSPTPENEVPNDVVDHPSDTVQQPSNVAGTEDLTEEAKVTIVDDRMDDIIQKNTRVMAIAADLKKMKMIQNETYFEIEAEKTNQAKMRELYKSLRASDLVKVAFYDALKNHEPNILKRHGDS